MRFKASRSALLAFLYERTRGKWICHFSLLRLLPSSFQSASFPSDSASCACVCTRFCRHMLIRIEAQIYLRLTSAWRRDEPRPRTKTSGLVLPDDFASGADGHRQAFLRQASLLLFLRSSPPTMTHRARLHNNRHIASTRMCLCGACEAQNSNIDFSIIFSVYG